MKILVTGFDPFGKDVVNPSIEAVKRLPDSIGDTEIVKLEIPTKFGESALLVQSKIKEVTPEYVLHIGQAGGRSQISPERVAINIDDAAIADNAGNQPIDQPIKADGAVAYFSSLPLKAMVKYMQDEDIPASISNTAGTFVCNHIMYQTLYYIAKEFPDMKSGFIHIPFITEQVKDRPNVPSLDLDDIVKGLVASIQAIIDFHTKDDLMVIGGKIH